MGQPKSRGANLTPPPSITKQRPAPYTPAPGTWHLRNGHPAPLNLCLPYPGPKAVWRVPWVLSSFSVHFLANVLWEGPQLQLVRVAGRLPLAMNEILPFFCPFRTAGGF